MQVEAQEQALAHSAWHASAMLCLLIAVGISVPADTAWADSSQALDGSGSTDISFPRRPAASAELDSAARRITHAGTKLTIPAIASAEQSEYGQMFTLIEIVNVSDSDAELKFSLRDASGNPLQMPFYNAACPACPAVALSSHSTDVEAKGATRLQIVQQNPARIGWAEFSIEPAAAVAVSGQIWFTADDGTVSFAGIPPTAAYRQAFLYLDNASDFETSLVLVNLNPANSQDLALHFRAADDPSVTCEASTDVPPFGQAVVTAVESLPCSVGKLGLLSIRGQDEFTGIAFVGSTEHDGVFTRQFVQPAPTAFTPLRHWTVSSGSVTFGGQSSSGCLTVANLSISEAIHTVHSSRWQKRTGEFSPWDDVLNSGRVGQVCAYSPSDPGHYRGVAEISVDGTRGMYATSNLLAIGGQGPPGEASGTRFNVGDTIPDMPSGFWAPSLVETGKGASFLFSGGSVTLAWTSSAGAIQYQTLSWTCASSGGCEVVNGRVTKGTIVQSGGTGGGTTPVDQRPRFDSASVGDQRFTVGMAIAPLTLPAASGGTGTLTYSLAPSVPGLTFSPPSRTLSGTPSRAGSYAMTYTATDADGDTETLNFTVSVAAGSSVGDGAGGGGVLPIGGGMVDGFELLAAHQNSRGIAWANDRFYAFNWLRRKVYAYTGTGQHDPDNDFAVVGIDVGPLHRFAYANGRFYLFHAQGDGGRLFAYTVTGQRDASRDLELHDDAWPRGVAYADGRFYVISVRGGKVYAYSASGDRHAAADFVLHSDNRSPSGIVYADGRLYVVDFDSGKVFAYTGSGTHDASADFALACGNVSPIGIAYAHGGFYVLNWLNRRVYTYAGIGGTSDSSPCFPGGSSPRSQTYTVGTPIPTLTLPAARGGAGPLKYSLKPNVPGLSFDATTRRLSGTPSGTGTYDMTYTVTDADDDTDTLSFTISVAAGSPADDGGGDGRFTVGDTIPDMPGGLWAPSLVETGKGASFVSSGRTVTLAWTSSAGVIQYQTLRWTCASSGGCEVVNRIVTKGTIVQGGESDGETPPDDQRPRFGSARVSDQSFTVGTAIRPLTLPGASGGDGTLAYSLAPSVPGLSFDATTRRLTGTPSGTGAFAMTYTATDADGDTDTLSFTVSVAAESPEGDGGGDGRFNVGDTIPDMPSGFWVPSLVETGKGASFVSSGGTVTLAWTSSAGVIQYNAFRWTCASDGGCEVVDGRVTKGTVVQSGTGG